MSGYFNIGKKIASGVGQAINKVKTKVNKTKLDKADSNLDIATQKSKASKAKLDQTVFENENKMPITFKSNKGKSESNTESYKRITGENNKVIKGMLDKAAGKK
jgi:hypothetical protein